MSSSYKNKVVTEVVSFISGEATSDTPFVRKKEL